MIAKPQRNILAALALLAALAAQPVLAQTYRCTAGGKNFYSDTPCGQSQQVISAAAPAGGASEGGPVRDGQALCSTQWVRMQPWNDPESVRIEGISGGSLVAITYMGKPMGARVFNIAINAKNSYGGYSGAMAYTCHTSEDGRRLLVPDRT